MFLWYKRSVPILCSIQIISNGPPSERQGNGFASSWFEPQRLRHYKSSHVPLSGTLNACPMYPSFCAVTLSTQLHIPLAKTKCPQNDWVEDKCWRVSKKTSNTCCPSCLLWKILPFRPPKKFELNSAGHSLPPTDWHKLQLTNDIKRRWKFVGTQLLVHLIQSRRPSPSLEHQWPGPSPSSLVGCWKSRTNLSHEKPSRHNELQEKHKNYNN